MGQTYGVRVGRKTGVFDNWAECKAQVDGYSGAVHKGFANEKDAIDYVNYKTTSLTELSIDTSIKIYVDGSYNSTKNLSGYGCVIIKDNKEVDRILGTIEGDETWNVGAELAGALAATDWAVKKGYEEITMYYDHLGIAHWANGSWKVKTPRTIDYANQMKEYKKKVDITFVKVKAHSGDQYNELADTLAKQAIKNEGGHKNV